MTRLFESAVTQEIDAIESEIRSCFETNAPIDPVKIKRLQELRLQRVSELVSTHEQRLLVMQGHTRTLTSKLTGLKSKGRPDVLEKIQEEMQKYDQAASRWVISEQSIWEDSEAANIGARILILRGEIDE